MLLIVDWKSLSAKSAAAFYAASLLSDLLGNLHFYYSDPLTSSSAIWTDEISFHKFPRIYKGVNYFFYRLFRVWILSVIPVLGDIAFSY